MPAKLILSLLFLISLGVTVIIFLQALPQQLDAETVAPKDEIVVATAALPAGSLLRGKDVMWQTVDRPERDEIRRRPGADDYSIVNLDRQGRGEIYGAALRFRIAANEPIRLSALVEPGDRDFLQIVLSPGARAIAIPVATGGASTGLLSPGDRVDVILTQTFKNDPPLARRSVSETVVENLRVLAIDAADAKAAATGAGFGRTVTLEVTPQQVEKINVATELGRLSLALRSTGATTPSPTASTVATEVKPTWAGDVSPALGDAIPHQASSIVEPLVEVFHGTKAVAVNLQ
jgi:pilus assembly protein CpaB